MYCHKRLCLTIGLLALFFIMPHRASGVVDPNLVAFWAFDEGLTDPFATTTKDSSIYRNDGMLKDGAFFATNEEKDLRYLNVNFGGGYVEIPDSDSLDITHELTILAWVKPSILQDRDPILCKGIRRTAYALRFHGDKGLTFTGNMTGHWNVDDPTDPNYAPGIVGHGDIKSTLEVEEATEANISADREWSFVGVISDTKTVEFIVNLENEKYPVSYIFATHDEPMTLGVYFPKDPGSSATQAEWFFGCLDDIRIYNRALSRREVITLSGLAERPFVPEPVNGAQGIISADLSWGSIKGSETLYMGTRLNNMEAVNEDVRGNYTLPDILPATQYFWRVDVETNDGTVTGNIWTFTTAGLLPSNPTPSHHGEYVDVKELALHWLPAFGADTYEVFLGTAMGTLEAQGQVDNPPYVDTTMSLISETEYYWRVDTVRGQQVLTGELWSFNTRPVFYVNEDLKGWYKFELGEGTTVRDWTDKGHDGFMVDAQWISEGYHSGAMRFNGASHYVVIPRVVKDDWTIMLWIRTDNLIQGGTGQRFRTNQSGLIDGDHGAQLDNFAMTFKSGYIQVGATALGYSDNESLTAKTAITDNDWHCIGWTRDAVTGEMIIYVDGVLDAQETREGPWSGTKDSQNDIWIGAHDYTDARGYWDGDMDEVKFFDRVLNTQEINDEMRPDKRLPYQPQPVSGGVMDQEFNIILSWTPGEGAVSHNVYFGTDANDLALIAHSHNRTHWEMGLLAPGNYYWKVGENLPDGKEILGSLWSYTVSDYLIIDDMESYTCDNLIWNTWSDAFSDDHDELGGSRVGYYIQAEDYCAYDTTEILIRHSGQQSMPFYYDNTGNFLTWNFRFTHGLHSEIMRSIPEEKKDFQRKDMKSLSLWFYGAPDNTVGGDDDNLYIALQDNSGSDPVVVPYPGPATHLLQPSWHAWHIDLNSFIDLELEHITTIYMGVGNRLNPVAGGQGLILIDDIRLYAQRCMANEIQPTADLNDDCVVDINDVAIVQSHIDAGAAAVLVTPTSGIPTDKLAGHWPLDGGVLEVISGESGSWSGLEIVNGRIGQAFLFDSESDSIDLGSQAGNIISGLNNCSFTLWVKPQKIGGRWQRFFHIGNDEQNYIMMTALRGDVPGDTPQFAIALNNQKMSVNACGGYTLSDTEWNHVVGTLDISSHTLTIHINGVAAGSATHIDLPAPKQLGVTSFNWMGQSLFIEDGTYRGVLDDFRIYSRVLHANEIAGMAGLTHNFYQFAQPSDGEHYAGESDLNRDGVVDALDLAIVQDAVGEQILWP